MPAKRQPFTAAVNFRLLYTVCSSYTVNCGIRAFVNEMQSIFLFKREGLLKICKHI
jgi:hypothetical protein